MNSASEALDGLVGTLVANGAMTDSLRNAIDFLRTRLREADRAPRPVEHAVIVDPTSTPSAVRIVIEHYAPSSPVAGTPTRAEAERVAAVVVDTIRRTPMTVERGHTEIIADVLAAEQIEVQP